LRLARRRELEPVIEPMPPPARDLRAEHLAEFGLSPAEWDRRHGHKPIRKVRRHPRWYDAGTGSLKGRIF
jgi:hypothetical protein